MTLCIECRYAECRKLFIVLRKAVMLSVIMPNDVMLMAVRLNVIELLKLLECLPFPGFEQVRMQND